MKILVVDDESIVLESCKRVLADCFEVIPAMSVDAALEVIRREAIGVILLDIKMPGRDGMSLLREVKEKWPNIPVIVMSGYTTTETVELVSRTEAATFIAKPFTPDQLLRAVKTAVDQAAASGKEDPAPVHKEEILRVLERATVDADFVFRMLHRWADALEEYDLTGAEKLALLTGDIEWIEAQVGPLTDKQKGWLQRPLSAEVLKIFGW
jgi:DNA-binding NtrC family response regulator